MNQTPSPWNAEAIYQLLRFSRKNDGPWDNPELWENENHFSMPDEDDADLIAWAPVIAAERDRLEAMNEELLEKLEKLLDIVENNWLDEEYDPEEWECYDEFRQVIAKAKEETE